MKDHLSQKKWKYSNGKIQNTPIKMARGNNRNDDDQKGLYKTLNFQFSKLKVSKNQKCYTTANEKSGK